MGDPFKSLRSKGDPIAVFEKAVDLVAEKVFQEQPPATVYHYTTWDAAEGILSSKEFWATAHDCTTDKAELLTADGIVDAVAERLKKDGRACAPLLEMLLDKDPKLHVSKIMPPFLACFSQARVKPSQWRNYADGGSGICLGISILPDERMPDDDFGRGFARVRYDAGQVEKEVHEAFSEICMAIQKAIDAGAKDHKRLAIIGLAGFHRVAARAAILAKNPTYSSEEEWRLFAVARPAKGDVHTRGTAEKPVRYVRLRVRPNGLPIALHEVLIGPRQDCENGLKRMAGILATAGYSDTGTKVPLVQCSTARIESSPPLRLSNTETGFEQTANGAA